MGRGKEWVAAMDVWEGNSNRQVQGIVCVCVVGGESFATEDKNAGIFYSIVEEKAAGATCDLPFSFPLTLLVGSFTLE